MATGAIEGRAVATEDDADMQLVALPFKVLEEVINTVQGLIPIPE